MPKQTFFNLPSEKKERIVETAYDLFIEKAYEDISIRMITSWAKISIGSFYKYFYDKDDLYLYLISEIEKKVYEREIKDKGSLLVNEDAIPLEEICSPKEIAFNMTWYKAPVEVMMKFYFSEYSRDLNNHVLYELNKLQRAGKIKDSVDINFAFHMYCTSMFNIQMYFRDNNIDDGEEKLSIKRNYIYNWLLASILNGKTGD